MTKSNSTKKPRYKKPTSREIKRLKEHYLSVATFGAEGVYHEDLATKR